MNTQDFKILLCIQFAKSIIQENTVLSFAKYCSQFQRSRVVNCDAFLQTCNDFINFKWDNEQKA